MRNVLVISYSVTCTSNGEGKVLTGEKLNISDKRRNQKITAENEGERAKGKENVKNRKE